MTAIIMAAGQSKRWQTHRGFENKYLVEVDGEPIYARTLRILKEMGCPEIYLSTNNEDLKKHPEYYYAANKTGAEIDRFLNTRALWKTKKQLIYFYGDVYYTRDALEKIYTKRVQDFAAFGRYGTTPEFSGQKTHEIFALAVKDPMLLQKACDCVYGLYQKGKLKRCQGWQVYRAMLGIPPTRGGAPNLKKLVTISDITTDFDKGSDYESWLIATDGKRLVD